MSGHSAIAPEWRRLSFYRHAADKWSLCGDLRPSGFGLTDPSNHEHEETVRQALPDDLAGRIHFDSEFSMFCAVAATWHDAWRLARVVNTVAADIGIRFEIVLVDHEERP